MFTTSLVRAVERFSAITQGVPDSELDRAWAWGVYDSEGVRFAFFRTYEELRDLAAKTAAARAAHGPAVSTAQRILAQYHWAYVTCKRRCLVWEATRRTGLQPRASGLCGGWLGTLSAPKWVSMS